MYLVKIMSEKNKDEAILLKLAHRDSRFRDRFCGAFKAKRKNDSEWIIKDTKIKREILADLIKVLKKAHIIKSYMLPRFDKIREGMKLDLSRLISLPSIGRKNFDQHDFLFLLNSKSIMR